MMDDHKEKGKLINHDNNNLVNYLINESTDDIENYISSNDINLNRTDMYFKYETQPDLYTNYLTMVINNNRKCMRDIIKILLKHNVNPDIKIGVEDTKRTAKDIWNINHFNEDFPTL